MTKQKPFGLTLVFTGLMKFYSLFMVGYCGGLVALGVYQGVDNKLVFGAMVMAAVNILCYRLFRTKHNALLVEFRKGNKKNDKS